MNFEICFEINFKYDDKMLYIDVFINYKKKINKYEFDNVCV